MREGAFEILLVEDDPTDAYLIEDVIKHGKSPVNVKTVEDGESALAVLRREGANKKAPRPDAIILDLHLPKMDGLEVLRAIKKDPDLKVIPVVILTTSKSDQDVLKSYGLGVNWFISKPSGIRDLEKTVASLEEFLLSVPRLPKEGKSK